MAWLQYPAFAAREAWLTDAREVRVESPTGRRSRVVLVDTGAL